MMLQDYSFGTLVLNSALLALSVYLATGGWRFAKVVIVTTPRDLTGLIRLIQTHWYLYKLRRRNFTVPQAFKENVEQEPNRIMFFYENEKWTAREIDILSNKVANAFITQGYKPGQEVALFMDSRPEFVAIWLGLAKAGIVSALINTNQRLDTLIHSVTVVNCKAVIFGTELSSAIDDVYEKLKSQTSLEFFHFGESDQCKIAQSKPLQQLINESSSNDPVTLELGNFTDRLFYIYTSGTTGLPKAAIIKHSRYMFVGAGLRNLLRLNRETLYTSIPLYHLAGGTMGTSQCILFDSCMVIKRRFSASQFWSDCIKYNATCAQYIGELCRYLLSQKPKPEDKQHKVRLMFGNGLRPQIWNEFINRFNMKQVGEFYGSTEGNANIVNFDNTPGACGFVSRILPIVYPVTLIKCNPETGVAFRNEKGVCVRCGPGETGEFVGKIIEGDPTRSFDGYANSEATKKKIVRDVFWKGDMAFSSGDLLEMDEYGYVYFKDRTGDTYRWKGENVSTMEVEGIISELLNQQDCVVFGVEVPNCEGKAGMLAISDKTADLKQLVERMRQKLAPFAIPVFIRIANEIEATGTFKLPKVKLQQQGYDINKVDDPIYLVDLKKNDCIRVTQQIYDDITSGNLKI